MTEPDFFDALAMMSVEESYPKKTQRLDELTDREKTGHITEQERKELVRLDTQLKREFDRCKLHYRLNWSFMTQEVKASYREKVEAWKER